MAITLSHICLFTWIFIIHSRTSIAEAVGCPVTLPNSDLEAVYDDKCFLFVDSEVGWTEARSLCHESGGDMLKLEDPDLNEWIVQKIEDLGWRGDGVWIGLHDRQDEGSFRWESRDGIEEVPDWTNWATGHPNDHWHTPFRDCVYMDPNDGYRWVETVCLWPFHSEYRYICQYDSNDVIDGDESDETSDELDDPDDLVTDRLVPDDLEPDDLVPDDPFTDDLDSEELGPTDFEPTPYLEEPYLPAQQVSNNSSDNQSGAFVGFGVGLFLLLAIILILIFFIARRRHTKNAATQASSPQTSAIPLPTVALGQSNHAFTIDNEYMSPTKADMAHSSPVYDYPKEPPPSYTENDTNLYSNVDEIDEDLPVKVDL